MKHGKNSFSVEGNTIICHPVGAFNIEGIKDYEAEFMALIANLESKHWNLLNLFKDFEICVPEVLEYLNRQQQWCQANGCQHAAFVTYNSVQEYVIREITKGVAFKSIEIFSDIGLAKQALANKTADTEGQ
jgi:hypothetical protein